MEKPEFTLTYPQELIITPGIRIELAQDSRVWSAKSSAPYIIETLIQQGLSARFKGANVIDLGCGGGILGIAAHLFGANKVLMTDNNPHAITLAKFNAEHNRMVLGSDFDVIQSDVLNDISEDFKADIIIGNLPMNPGFKDVQFHIKDEAARSNQNPNHGRYVLDSAINNAKRFLKPGGLFIATASGRQNQPLTEEQLEMNFPGSWYIANGNGVDEPLDPNYHGPFVNFWITQSFGDRIMRIYQKDEMGNPYLEFPMDAHKIQKLVTYTPPGENPRIVQVIANGTGTKVYEFSPEDPNVVSISETITPDMLPAMPDENRSNLFHKYYILVAENN